MRSQSQSAAATPDWATQVRRFDTHLTSATPLYTGHSVFPEVTSLQLDVHAGVEIGIVLAGAEERHFLDYVLPVLPGEAWLSAMWEPHGFRAVRPKTETVVLVFLPEFLADEMICDRPWHHLLAVPPAQRPRVTTAGMRQAVLGIGGELRQETDGRRPGWATVVRANLLRLLTLLRREWRAPPPAAGVSRGGVQNLIRLQPAIGAVRAHPTQHLSTPEAAALCGLSAAQLHRLFQRAMGMSYAQFSLRARLAHVARMLTASDLPAEAIARDAGFTDASHMHRTFVKHYGRTPRQYRELS